MTKKININRDALVEIINITSGAYAPLTGFLGEQDFKSVIGKRRMANGTVWPMPIVLDINRREYLEIKDEERVELYCEDVLIAYLKKIEVYTYDKNELCSCVYNTCDKNHPGVRGVFAMEDYLLGGELELANDYSYNFYEVHHTALECREIFKQRGWKKIVAFQTRNVPHLGHEFLQMKALEQVDGLLVHPVIGKKKSGDFRPEVIMGAYRILMDKYYPQDRCLLSALNLRMRYAGPVEALFHALVRRNFGCTHFIVGRDHAGVGDYYEPYAAQEIFNNFSSEELGIEILKFEEVVFDKIKKEYCFKSECEAENRMLFSGTALRDSIVKRNNKCKHLVRPDIYDYLVKQDTSPFVE